MNDSTTENIYYLDRDNCMVCEDCTSGESNAMFGPYEGPFPYEPNEEGEPEYCEQCGIEFCCY